MVRIYLAPRERAPGSGKGWFGDPPLYRAPVITAKTPGIRNAFAHHSHVGFSDGGALQSDNCKTGNPHLPMHVDVIGNRSQLEAFCRQHGAWLKGKVIVFKHLEEWRVGAGKNGQSCAGR